MKLGLLAAAWLASLAAADTITLKDEAYVKGPKVRLGDVAHVDGENADFLESVEVTNAAIPGSSKRLDAALLLSRIEQAGVDTRDVEVKGPRHVTATTLFLDVDSGMIEENLRKFIRENMPWDSANAVIDIRPPSQSYKVPDGELTFHWRRDPQYNFLGNGAFRGELAVDGETEQNIVATATVEAYGEVVVAARNIRRGDLITTRDLTTEKRALSTVDEDVFFHARDVTGYVAKRSFLRGQPITEDRIMAPKLVERNQTVIVETQIGSLTIRTRAKAMADGAAGDLVPCINPKSKDEFLGVLRKDGVIVVE